MSKTLLLAVSAHGLGHLGQTAPLLTALQAYDPALKIILFSSLPAHTVRSFIPAGVELVAAPEHVTIAMQGPLRVNIEETVARFTQWHQHYREHCQAYCDIVSALKPDLVLSNVDYTILSAARKLDIPAIAMCSLNWADILRPLMRDDVRMQAVCDEISAVYRQAEHFIRVSPGMPMADLDNRVSVAPLARSGTRHSLQSMLGLPNNTHMVMFSLGGIEQELDIAHWTLPDNTHCIIPDSVRSASPVFFTRLADTGLCYIDALASVDVLVTKPGYGNFCESWKNKTAVIYVRRDSWPEETVLLDWIHRQCPAVELSQEHFSAGDLRDALSRLNTLKQSFTNGASGEQEVVSLLSRFLR